MKHYTVLRTQSNLTTALLKALLVDCADCVHSGFTHTHTHTHSHTHGDEIISGQVPNAEFFLFTWRTLYLK